MGKCLTKMALTMYGVCAILFCISSPMLGEALYAYGPEFFRNPQGLKFGVVASWFLLWLGIGVSAVVSFVHASDIKCE